MSAPSWPARIGWILLVLVLIVICAGTVLVERDVDDRLRPGEGTTWAQAASLAYDLDLEYSRADYDRLVIAQGAQPADLELVSGSGGRRIGFGRPFPLALWNAPFVLLSPRHGVYVANATLLLIAVGFLVGTLRRVVGSQAPWWGLAFLLGTTGFAQVFRAGDTLQLASLGLLAGCLVLSSRRPASDLLDEVYRVPDSRSMAARWALAGALLAVLVAHEVLYLPMILAWWWSAPEEGRAEARRGLVVGLLLALTVFSVAEMWTSGGLPLVGTTRFRFTASTGFPAVDFPAEAWDPTVRRLAALHWDGAARWTWGLDPRLFVWNLLYFFIGARVSLLVTAPALLLIPFSRRRAERGLRSVLLASLLWVVVVLLVRPFDVHGGEGSLANALVLPALALVWPLVAGRVRALGGLVTAGLVVLVLGFVWQRPVEAVPGEALRRWLPTEVTQRWLGAPTDFLGGYHARVLSGEAWIEARRDRLMVASRRVEVLLAGAAAGRTWVLIGGEGAPSGLTVGGGELGPLVLRPDGGFERTLELSARGRVHAMWWGPDAQDVYVLSIELPAVPDEPIPLRLVPASHPEESDREAGS